MIIFNEINITINVGAAIVSAALAVIVGVRIREVGVRTYILTLMTAILTSGAVIETWFSDSTLFKSSAIGWLIGYAADDVILNLNVLMPDFVKEITNKVLNNMKKWIGKKTDIDENGWR